MTSRIAHARDFEDFSPPADALFYGRESRAFSGRIRLAEHHVVGALLGGEHRVVPAGKPARTRDAFGFERFKCDGEIRDTAEMRAVGATARHQIGVAIEQKCGVFVLDRRASALTRLIKVRSSASASRSSTAATSPASKAEANWSKNVDGSATGGVIR